MKITLLVATSLDGFINHVGQKLPNEWTSPEDKKHATEILQQFDVQLMGSTTYEAYKDLFKATSRFRRIIFTKSPENYNAVAGTFEFTDEPIGEVVKRLADEGVEKVALMGGGVIFTQFLEAGLVDEIYQTIEPQTFGEGIPFLTNDHSLADFSYLELVGTETLNSEGTKLLHYLRKQA